MTATDWMWCYENPREAASALTAAHAEIEALRAKVEAPEGDAEELANMRKMYGYPEAKSNV